MLRDNILVKQMTKKQLGSIIMPENSIEDDWLRGKVIAVGPGLLEKGKRVPTDCQVDDVVVIPQMPGGGRHPCVNIDGEEHIIFNDKFVWAIED